MRNRTKEAVLDHVMCVWFGLHNKMATKHPLPDCWILKIDQPFLSECAISESRKVTARPYFYSKIPFSFRAANITPTQKLNSKFV